MGVEIKKEKHYFSRFALLIAAVTLRFVTLTLSILYFGMGYRFVSYRYTKTDGGKAYSARALVRVDKEGEMFTGTVWTSNGEEFTFSRLDYGYFSVEYIGGDRYEGGLDRLLRSGEGTLTMANGDVYEGEFAYDLPWGKGNYRYANGDSYEGDFVAGKKNGLGVYTWASVSGEGVRRYEGSFANDMRNGYGTYQYANGSIYAGDFKNDLKCDTDATLTLVNEDGSQDIYVGGFENDVKNGKGEYRWASGAVYVGDFKNDVMEGQGTYTWPGSNHSYTGTFKGNKPYIEDKTE